MTFVKSLVYITVSLQILTNLNNFQALFMNTIKQWLIILNHSFSTVPLILSFKILDVLLLFVTPVSCIGKGRGLYEELTKDNNNKKRKYTFLYHITFNNIN